MECDAVALRGHDLLRDMGATVYEGHPRTLVRTWSLTPSCVRSPYRGLAAGYAASPRHCAINHSERTTIRGKSSYLIATSHMADAPSMLRPQALRDNTRGRNADAMIRFCRISAA